MKLKKIKIPNKKELPKELDYSKIIKDFDYYQLDSLPKFSTITGMYLGGWENGVRKLKTINAVVPEEGDKGFHIYYLQRYLANKGAKRQKRIKS